MSIIKEFQGNIFESSCQTLVNTVNCVGIMGRGIALEFKNRFPEMYDEYARYCADKRIHPGVLHLWKKSEPWILNFPTKNHWKYPSKIEYIEQGMAKFSATYAIKGITSIAFPELGASLGGLQWSAVKEIMYRYLERLPNLEVEIYHFDPNAEDSLFNRLHQRIHRFSISDYKRYLGIGAKQARLLIDAFSTNTVHSMLDIQETRGVGDKTIQSLYEFAKSSDQTRRLITQAERQPSLVF
ncbi:MAG TPA: macro domain-containing protein [Cyclobacteriaceae bacterium]|nr:macro domain-containing protein [Cyclobacteriaceae bacterium]